MALFWTKLDGNIDRRSPPNEGNPNDPVLRENWLARDGVLHRPKGTEKAINTLLDDKPRWMGRYYTVETGQISPKTFVYTQDGQLWSLNDQTKIATSIKKGLNLNAYPRHLLFKTADQTRLFLVDGKDLYEYDGNNDNLFEKVVILDADENTINPIDLIEHKDRLLLISETILYISKNLSPKVFDDTNDSLAVIIGSARGKNLAIGTLEDKLYIFNTEGIFALSGDVISALAITFEVRLVDEKKIIAGRTLTKVEKAFNFLADDYEIWSWDGINSNMLTFNFKLKDFVFQNREMLDKASGEYFNNYYMLSFVENGDVEPNTEIWWDAFENKIDVVKGRNVACYMKTDPTREANFLQIGRSDENYIMNTEIADSFGGTAIAKKLRTRNLTVTKGENVRFTAFYFELEPTGSTENLVISYLLNSRLSNPDGSQNVTTPNLKGEVITLGSVDIKNQLHFTTRVRPKINYARGESVAFEMEDATLDLDVRISGLGMDFIKKAKVKKKTVGA